MNLQSYLVDSEAKSDFIKFSQYMSASQKTTVPSGDYLVEFIQSFWILSTIVEMYIILASTYPNHIEHLKLCLIPEFGIQDSGFKNQVFTVLDALLIKTFMEDPFSDFKELPNIKKILINARNQVCRISGWSIAKEAGCDKASQTSFVKQETFNPLNGGPYCYKQFSTFLDQDAKNPIKDKNQNPLFGIDTSFIYSRILNSIKPTSPSNYRGFTPYVDVGLFSWGDFADSKALSKISSPIYAEESKMPSTLHAGTITDFFKKYDSHYRKTFCGTSNCKNIPDEQNWNPYNKYLIDSDKKNTYSTDNKLLNGLVLAFAVGCLNNQSTDETSTITDGDNTTKISNKLFSLSRYYDPKASMIFNGQSRVCFNSSEKDKYRISSQCNLSDSIGYLNCIKNKSVLEKDGNNSICKEDDVSIVPSINSKEFQNLLEDSTITPDTAEEKLSPFICSDKAPCGVGNICAAISRDTIQNLIQTEQDSVCPSFLKDYSKDELKNPIFQSAFPCDLAVRSQKKRCIASRSAPYSCIELCEEHGFPTIDGLSPPYHCGNQGGFGNNIDMNNEYNAWTNSCSWPLKLDSESNCFPQTRDYSEDTTWTAYNTATEDLKDTYTQNPYYRSLPKIHYGRMSKETLSKVDDGTYPRICGDGSLANIIANISTEAEFQCACGCPSIGHPGFTPEKYPGCYSELPHIPGLKPPTVEMCQEKCPNGTVEWYCDKPIKSLSDCDYQGTYIEPSGPMYCCPPSPSPNKIKEKFQDTNNLTNLSDAESVITSLVDPKGICIPISMGNKLGDLATHSFYSDYCNNTTNRTGSCCAQIGISWGDINTGCYSPIVDQGGSVSATTGCDSNSLDPNKYSDDVCKSDRSPKPASISCPPIETSNQLREDLKNNYQTSKDDPDAATGQIGLLNWGTSIYNPNDMKSYTDTICNSMNDLKDYFTETSPNREIWISYGGYNGPHVTGDPQFKALMNNPTQLFNEFMLLLNSVGELAQSNGKYNIDFDIEGTDPLVLSCAQANPGGTNKKPDTLPQSAISATTFYSMLKKLGKQANISITLPSGSLSTVQLDGYPFKVNTRPAIWYPNYNYFYKTIGQTTINRYGVNTTQGWLIINYFYRTLIASSPTSPDPFEISLMTMDMADQVLGNDTANLKDLTYNYLQSKDRPGYYTSKTLFDTIIRKL